MKIVTVINDKNNLAFNLLSFSCALNNLQLEVLVSRLKHFSSNRIKDELLKDYLDHKVKDDETILFTDGNDALIMAQEEEINSKFVSTGKEILFSAESGCWPDASLAEQYPDSGTSVYKYLNSGGFIGKAGAIREMLEDDDFDLYNFRKSNQYLWAKRYLKYPTRIGLDTGCEIFQTFSPEVGSAHLPKGNIPTIDFQPYYECMKQWFNSNFKIEGGRIYSDITQTWPCHAHFNGYSKWLIDYDITTMVLGTCEKFRQPVFMYEGD